MNLLTLNQAKMLKSTGLGYLSAIMNLQPAYRYKGLYTCLRAGSCAHHCLKFVGKNCFDASQIARIRKTQLLVDSPEEFKALLVADLYALQRKAKRDGLLPSCRLDGLSDVGFEAYWNGDIFRMFPDIQFLDYTKRYERLEAIKAIPNYHVTYSMNENTPPGTAAAFFEAGYNVAAVFAVDKGAPLPATTVIDGKRYNVIDGDESDLRHLDNRGAIVGLRFKKAATKARAKYHNVESALAAGFVTNLIA